MSWLEQWRRSTREAPLYTEIRGDGKETLVFIAGLGGTTRSAGFRSIPKTVDAIQRRTSRRGVAYGP